MSRIFITGDTHGDKNIYKVGIEKLISHEKLTKKDYLIILGDFGAVWFGDKDSFGNAIVPNNYSMGAKLKRHIGADSFLLDIWESRPFTTLFIDGNHENHKLLNSYPVSKWNGGKVHIIRPSIIHLMRGQIYNINGMSFFTMGGASSVDRLFREENYSWFEEELPSDEELNEGLFSLEMVDWNVDYVLTHCCSYYQLKKIQVMNGDTINGSYKDCLCSYFDKIEDCINLKRMWYFGHHHIDNAIDDKHTAVYKDVIEIF